MQDKTIDNALLALRKQIIRGNSDGLCQVEVLLQIRGVAMPAVLPAKRQDAARRGHMRLLVLEALIDGQNTQQAVTGYVAERRPELNRGAVYHRVSLCLARMKREGLVAREGRVWSTGKAEAFLGKAHLS